MWGGEEVWGDAVARRRARSGRVEEAFTRYQVHKPQALQAHVISALSCNHHQNCFVDSLLRRERMRFPFCLRADSASLLRVHTRAIVDVVSENCVLRVVPVRHVSLKIEEQ